MATVKNVALVHRGVRRWRRLGRRVPDPEAERVSRQHCPESDHLVGGRRGGDTASPHRAGRTGSARGPFLRRRGDHGSGHPSEGGGPRVHHGLRAGCGRIRVVAHEGSATGAPVPPILPPQDGFLALDKAKFRASFAADVDADKAAFMADSQVPWGLAALSGTISAPAWKSKPSWYLVVTEDQMIPVGAQRLMAKRAGSTVTKVKGSHAIYVSQPAAVATLIEQAAKRGKPSKHRFLHLGGQALVAAENGAPGRARHALLPADPATRTPPCSRLDLRGE